MNESHEHGLRGDDLVHRRAEHLRPGPQRHRREIVAARRAHVVAHESAELGGGRGRRHPDEIEAGRTFAAAMRPLFED